METESQNFSSFVGWMYVILAYNLATENTTNQSKENLHEKREAWKRDYMIQDKEPILFQYMIAEDLDNTSRRNK